MTVPPMFLATGGFDGLIVIWNSVSETPNKFLIQRKKNMSQQHNTNTNSAKSKKGSAAMLKYSRQGRRVSRQPTEKADQIEPDVIP